MMLRSVGAQGGPEALLLCYLLEQIASAIDGVFLSQLCLPSRARLGNARIIQQCRQRLGDRVSIELRWHDPAPDAEPPETGRVVRLIESERHRQLRDASGQPLRECSNSSVMHDRGAAWQYG